MIPEGNPFHSSYKIHQLFTDYLLRLPSSDLLEKHLFRSRANRRLVFVWCFWSALPVVLLFLCAVPGVSYIEPYPAISNYNML